MLGLFRARSAALADKIESFFKRPKVAPIIPVHKGEYVVSAGEMFLTPTGWSWDRSDALVLHTFADAEKIRLKLLGRDDKLDGLFSVLFYLKGDS